MTGLNTTGIVHFARFSIVDGNLCMFSIYDGDFSNYIRDFIATIGSAFDALLMFIKDHADRSRSRTTSTSSSTGSTRTTRSSSRSRSPTSATTSRTLPRQADAAPRRVSRHRSSSCTARTRATRWPRYARRSRSAGSDVADLDLDDIQGNILRGYRMEVVRHIVVHVEDRARGAGVPRRGRRRRPRSRGRSSPPPRTGTPSPTVCLNVGVTATGLSALGVSAKSLATFPKEFRDGAVGAAP